MGASRRHTWYDYNVSHLGHQGDGNHPPIFMAIVGCFKRKLKGIPRALWNSARKSVSRERVADEPAIEAHFAGLCGAEPVTTIVLFTGIVKCLTPPLD